MAPFFFWATFLVAADFFAALGTARYGWLLDADIG
jgi:hypothetical protein